MSGGETWTSVNAPSKPLSLCEAVELVGPSQYASVTVQAVFDRRTGEGEFLFDPSCHKGVPTTLVQFAAGAKDAGAIETEATRNPVRVTLEGTFYGPSLADTTLPRSVRIAIAQWNATYVTKILVNNVVDWVPLKGDPPHPSWDEGDRKAFIDERVP
jgi:hypothetical protein